MQPERQKPMRTIATSIQKCTVATLVYLTGWAGVATAETYCVPAAFVPGLETECQAIAACTNKVSQLQVRLCVLRQEFAADEDAAKRALEATKREYEKKIYPYQAKLGELTVLLQQRKQAFEADLAGLPLLAQDHPAEYNRKVYWRNDSRTHYSKDLREAAVVISQLKTEMRTHEEIYLRAVQAIQRAYRESFQARKQVYDGVEAAFLSEQTKANGLIISYNTRLQTCGTPAKRLARD